MNGLISVLVVMLPLWAKAQLPGPGFPDRRYTRFADGSTSTLICYDKAMRYGKAIAYDRRGRVIYRQALRYGNGSSTVVFGFYTDSAVRRAEWHDNRADGKWYSSVTLFAPDGRVTNVRRENYDDTLRKHMLPKKRTNARK